MCSERGDASEIEVTPEMTEAGAKEVIGFDPDRESSCDVAIRVYQEMEAVRRFAGCHS